VNPSPCPRRSWLIVVATGLLIPLATIGVAGCSSKSPTLYTMSMVPGSTHQGAPRVVVVREVSLAPYLQRQPIVRSSANYRIEVSPNEWWGEPPGAMLTRVLVDNLNQRLPGSTVIQERGALSATGGTTVEVNITQLDADASGQVVLQAAVAIDSGKRKAPPPRRLRFATPPAPGTAGQVSAISVLVGQLADVIAAMVTTG
jgi:uncharacterized lipoprotein YmbA